MSRTTAPRTRVATLVGLAALCAGIALTMSRSPAVLARSNLVNTATQFETLDGPFATCQGNETLPAHVTAIRLSLDSVLGPRIHLKVFKVRQLLTEGQRAPGWTAADVTIPVRPVAAEASGVSVCFAFTAKDESVGLTGEPVARSRTTGNDTGLVKIEYMRPGGESWWSLLSTIADHMAFGHAWSGSWIAPALALAMALIVAAVAWSAIRLAR